MRIHLVARGRLHDIETDRAAEKIDLNFQQLFADVRKIVESLKGYRIDLASDDVTGNLAVAHLNGGLNADGAHVWAGDGTWQPMPADGVDSVDGADGANGANGVGVPVGGATGDVLTKTSGADFATGWAAPTGGGSGLSAARVAAHVALGAL
jgi:hypothetical protein